MGLAGVLELGRAGAPRLAGSLADQGRAGDVECVLDGWIADRDALRHRFGRPHDDGAALLAHGWAQEGEALLTRLRGDFALLLWDHARGRGILARDQLGGRSLYYRATGRELVFADDVRGVLELLPARPPTDRVALCHWVAGRDVRDGRTFFEGVRALLPGHLIELGDTGASVRRWWAPRYATPDPVSRGDAVAAIRARLETAVLRASADRPAAVLMSGGLDSTGVAAIAARGAGATGYSAVFPETPTVDESGLIDATSAALGIACVRDPVRIQSMLAAAAAFPSRWRLPLRPQNLYVWLPLLRRAAGDGATTMLDGEGGDLLFGARRELIADRLLSFRPVAAVGLARALPGRRPRGGTRLVLREYGVRNALPPAWHASGPARRRVLADIPPWVRSDDALDLAARDDMWGWKRIDGPRWWARMADSLGTGLEAVGIRDHVRRRAAMAGLEARSPFFDVDLVELVLRLPPELAFDRRFSRPLQRDAMLGLLPDAVRLRPGKSYFDELFQRSLAQRDLEAVRSLLGARDAEIGAFVDLAAVRAQLVETHPARHPRGARYWVNSAWRLATAECWLRQEADDGFAARMAAQLQEPSGVPSQPVGDA